VQAAAESRELLDTLSQLLRDEDFDAHHRVSSADYRTELTVMLDRT